MRLSLLAPALLLAAPALAAPDGASLFANNCSACHQAHGEGIEGAFPKLAGNAFVQGDPKAVAETLLNGRGGMPSFKDQLKDDELSAIISTVRSSWGNTAPPIPPKTFTAIRNGAVPVPAKPTPGH
ncbi:mono/diheme cytochrome c family protein [Sphingomonas vulcanisoli]|uniref:Mono/diheme cytochrome c family protein n=1 Tax=Sphingomonas vulcanisoli TaxID=1658060 RepID=A0ABX0TSL8_9SPHN|nr:cytochrome c [Sphingomonas vulcanisoli]NIJ06790.1 mono/diheme cytochrome c family protein [Sphingomonas vulcanisoli]